MREFSDYTLNLISFRNCIHYLNLWFHEKNHNPCDAAITLFVTFVRTRSYSPQCETIEISRLDVISLTKLLNCKLKISF